MSADGSRPEMGRLDGRREWDGHSAAPNVRLFVHRRQVLVAADAKKGPGDVGRAQFQFLPALQEA